MGQVTRGRRISAGAMLVILVWADAWHGARAEPAAPHGSLSAGAGSGTPPSAVAPAAPPPPSFRRVSLSDLPEPGARITVRIDAETQAREIGRAHV